jgi:hypothetical protein
MMLFIYDFNINRKGHNMSRTYRKNTRWFFKVHGLLLSTYKDRTIKKEFETFEDDDFSWVGNGWRHKRMIVTVGDVDNIPRQAGSEIKTMHRRIDRSRYRNALNKDMEDPLNVVSSFDPWIYD